MRSNNESEKSIAMTLVLNSSTPSPFHLYPYIPLLTAEGMGVRNWEFERGGEEVFPLESDCNL